MSAEILDGRAVARSMRQEIADDVAQWAQEEGQPPTLAIVQMGSDPASDRYVRAIERGFTGVGMLVKRVALAADATQERLAESLEQLSMDDDVQGVIVQLPLPLHIKESVLHKLSPSKDVDGIHPLNAGLLLQHSKEALVPATPLGAMELLRRYNIDVEGKSAVLVGRSRIVGLPMAMLLLHQHATVTVCHTRTRDLAKVTRTADILAVAAGQPGMVTREMVRSGTVVIDFGINLLDGEMVGDVDKGVAEVASYMTPVPGGTGPMTNMMLMRNTLQAAQRQRQERQEA
jgi:methylenetetrahydrofolate dehydrogenase (NADP+) / methenyltetrahydrofolate cyclohydrolase